jgi:hypothetical protein
MSSNKIVFFFFVLNEARKNLRKLNCLPPNKCTLYNYLPLKRDTFFAIPLCQEQLIIKHP